MDRGPKTEIDYQELKRMLASAKSEDELYRLIVNAPFKFRVQTSFFFLGIIVLLLVNKKTGEIERIALSDTEYADRTTEVSVVPFNEIKIRLKEPNNIIATAIKSDEMQDTTDWKYLFYPSLTPEQARINQANAGIAYSAVYPLKARDGGALIFSYYQYPEYIGQIQRDFMTKYSQHVNDQLNVAG